MLEPAEKIVIAYLAVLAALILWAHSRIEPWAQLVLVQGAGIALVVAIAQGEAYTRRQGSPAAMAIAGSFRSWYLIPGTPIIYSELRYLIPLIHPHDFDAALANLDQAVFGVHPTVWLERWHHPLLTEVLQLSYAAYYLLPIIFGLVLWHTKRFEHYRFWLFAAVLGFLVSYIGYISVPATGPRFLPLVMNAQSIPLSGVWLYQPIRSFLDNAEGITRDCFPSGHTEITLLVLYYGYRYHRLTFWIMLPIGIGIVFSTVYLRYHYVVDVIAGVLVTVLVIAMAKPLYVWLGGAALDEV